MAQDHPPTFGQGYPQDHGGQEPTGYDYQQQPWYPAASLDGEQPYQAPAPDPFDGSRQPWEWQQPVPRQREPEPGGYPGYPGGEYQAEYQQAAPYAAVADPGYQPAPGYPSSGYESGPGAQAGPYADPYAPQEAYADPTATLAAGTAFGAEAAAEPGAAPPDTAVQDTAVQGSAVQGSAADAGDTEADTDPSGRAGADEAPGQGSLLDRARAAFAGGEATDRRALLIRAGAGVAALGVLLTAGLVATRGSGGSAHHDSASAPSSDAGFAVAHNRIWTAQPAAAQPAQPGQPAPDDTLVGSWLLADAVVRADSTGLHAYDLAAGKATWSIDAPSPGAVPCGLSPTVNAAGIGGALFRTQADPKSPCTLLVAVDTKAGKAVWNKPLADGQKPFAAQVAVTDDKVVAVGDDKAQAWSAADGKDAWQYGGPGKFCTLSGSAQGGTVLLHSSCADSAPGEQAVALSTADGKVLWARELKNAPKTVTTLSAEPAVMLVTGDQPADEKLLAWGQNGDPGVEIPVQSADGRLDAGHGGFSPVPGVFLQDHTLVTTLVPAAADGTPAVVGYDLATGKQLWRTQVSEKGTVRAVGLDNGSLVLAADERLGQPAHLSRFALANGQETVGGAFPPGTGSLLSSGRLLIGDGRVVVVPEHSTHFGTAAAYQAKS
ncbi:hypothetical protein GCM10009665_31970 [Kitasatospora nipponensis]|uniref:Pyrrolo-quinoline quinone repeat domain-containing protein n=1 Tax=Kitasatospora nipponensis TaxID=258049 RepID=A0ABN1W7F0_9ACTN